MFRHKGKKRTYLHNLRLASMLSFIAGLVNVTGVLSVRTLTTNVTGHFAFFAEELTEKKFSIAFIFLFYIFSFLLGAFISNLTVEITVRIKPRIAYALPMFFEMCILGFIGTLAVPDDFQGSSTHIIACALLFTMGMQNSLVTKVSDSVVRTTHLTGLFTDLGIELSQLFIFKLPFERVKLKKSIYLRLAIIAFFFFGCIISGYLYRYFHLKVLLLAAICLLFALLYDSIRYSYYRLIRKMRNN